MPRAKESKQLPEFRWWSGVTVCEERLIEVKPKTRFRVYGMYSTEIKIKKI